MSNIAIQGAETGTGVFTLASPATNTDRTLTLPDEAGTVLTSVGALSVNASAPAASATIDASGNLLVGNTETTPHSLTSGGGFSVRGALNVLLSVARQDNECVIFNRTNSNGDIALFRKNGTTVGKIGTSTLAAGEFFVAGASGLQFRTTDMLPTNSSGAYIDNFVDVGDISVRFDDIYATNGTIQTSDRNEKQDIEVLSEAETRVAVACKGLLRKFRWKDKVAEKGDEARIHFGIIAQDLQAAFAAEGLDAGRYAMFISSTWWEAERVVPAVEEVLDDEGNVVTEAVAEHTVVDHYESAEEAPEGATERTRLGVRYPELLAFIIGAI